MNPGQGCSVCQLCSLPWNNADREGPCCGGGGEFGMCPPSLAACEMADVPRGSHECWALPHPTCACFVAGRGAEGSAAGAGL